MNLFKQTLLILAMGLSLVGCGPSVMGLDASKPHALIVPILDDEHNHGNAFGKFSSLFIESVNGKETDLEFRSRQRNIPVGKVTLVVNEEYAHEIKFIGKISFVAKEGKKYILTSELEKIGNRKVSSELRILDDNNKIIARAKTTSIVVKTPVYVPVYMPM
ncbi:MAG: hypothetical protein ACP5D3_07300 [Sulfurovum sp.]